MIPKKLLLGDTIGIIAPSNPINDEDIDDINSSIKLVEKEGFRIKLGENVFSNKLGYGATVQEKAYDINKMFSDEHIKAIFCARGGFNSNSLFEYINYELIANNPKIICGFSDSTSIINIINEKTGLVTFHGPTFKGLASWDLEYGFKEVIKRFVDKDIKLIRNNEQVKIIRKGLCTGKLVGGNLSLFSRMICGKYNLDLQDKILFIEDLGIESNPAMISNYFYYMKQNDVFKKIKGLWIGDYEHESNITMEEILLNIIEDEYNFPIVKSDNFGHCDKKTVIPIGTVAKIDTNTNEIIGLLENCIN